MRLEEEEPKKDKKKGSVEERIDEALLAARRIFLSDGVDGDSTKDIIRKLWYLEIKDPGKPILLVINSPGGSVDSGFAVWDQIKLMTSPVTTLVTGLAASMGSVLSLAAAPGRRFATANARIMIHQPSIHGLIRGQATDLDIQAKEIMKTRKAIVQLYVNATGKEYSVVDKAIDRDAWMSPEEAVAFGLLDKVITSHEEVF